MALSMRERQAITKEMARRYKRAAGMELPVKMCMAPLLREDGAELRRPV